jgi:signal transduction histidine kinase
MYEVENRLRTKSGEYRWNLDRGRVVEWDNKGRPMRMVGVDIDISDRKRADDEATKRIAAEAADAAKDTFISLVTHELRNPLSTISMAVSRLKAAPSSEDNRRVRMGMIERATEQQLMLVNDLLDWSRLQSNKFELHLEAANLSDVVTSAWHPVEAAAALRDIHKELHIEAGTERLFIDPKRMTQALWNLFANAVKFTPTGGKIIVRTSLNATLSISVTDSGRGVSAEDLPYLFERGWQAQTTDATRKGGLGLGLALVREIVEAHGGTIRAESAGADKGTTFTIQLPASTVQQLPLAAN